MRWTSWSPPRTRPRHGAVMRCTSSASPSEPTAAPTDQALARGEEASELSRALGDRRQLLIALVVRGGVGVYEGNAGRAAECFAEAHGLCQELGDKWAEAWLHTGLGIAARRDGRQADAA